MLVAPGQGVDEVVGSRLARLVAMCRAKSLLRETPLNLHEIAVRVGFAGGAAFSRVFTRREGTSPAAWRRSRP
jgi:transcriptional regulator GlxA family with amidase domain